MTSGSAEPPGETGHNDFHASGPAGLLLMVARQESGCLVLPARLPNWAHSASLPL